MSNEAVALKNYTCNEINAEKTLMSHLYNVLASLFILFTQNFSALSNVIQH